AVNNGDNDYDLSIFLNDGDGTFDDGRTDYAAGNYPHGLVVGDFDGDGWFDYAVMNQNDNDVAVFLNDGDGTFDDNRADYAVAGTPRSGITAADFNLDGWLDIAVACHGPDDTSILLNDGDGTFTVTTYNWGDDSWGLATGDVDGDGDLDLFVPNEHDDDVSVFFNLALNGTSGPCCGDDLIVDNFYNSSHICLDGYVTQEGDTGRADCESLGYSWFDNSLVGVNGPCCGDDLYYDDFYNGTASDTEHLCYDGVFYSGFDNGGAGCDGFGFNWVSGVNKTLLAGDIDYYGTYSFTDDAIGVPGGWTWDGSYSSVISGQDGHNKVLRFIVGSSYTTSTNVYTDFEEQTSGTVEFWYQYDSYANNWFRFYLKDEYGTNAIECARYTDNHLLCRVQDSYTHFTNIGGNNWYHFRIDFECGGGGYQGLSSDSYHFYLNGEKLLDNVKFYNNVGSIDQLRFRMYNSINNRKSYIDAIGYSWDPYYDVGDNYLASTCCGDDGVDDDFYNATDGYGGFCSDGSYFFGDADGNKGACELLDYEWFTNLIGEFTLLKTFSSYDDARDITSADFNEDGHLDFFLGEVYGRIRYYTGDGLGNFTYQFNLVDVGYFNGGLDTGDFDEDGHFDLIIGDSSGNIRFFKGDGTGVFTGYTVTTALGSTMGLTSNDFNESNGVIDLVTCDYDGELEFFNGDGLGNFTSQGIFGDTGYQCNSMTSADFNEDGNIDILAGDYYGEVWFYAGDGAGGFTNQGHVDDMNIPIALTSADFNKDGHQDFILGASNPARERYFTGNGDGTFINHGDVIDAGSTGPVFGLTSADFNEDGDIDILAYVHDVYQVSDGLVSFLDGFAANGPCCGDDSSSDDFYNSSRACFDGLGSTNGDVLQGFCEASGYEWLLDAVTGNNPRCCGDDGVDDDFYNATDGYGGFCSDGSYFFGEADGDEGACSLLGYDWLGGATDQIGNCCGDDSGLDDFGNNTGSCCCNGVLVPSGTECDLDQDGNVDALCENGNLPDVYISSSTYDEGYVTSTYQPEFLIKNTGNETICFSNIEFTNTTMSYTPSASNPECVEPGNSGLFSFDFGGFRCEDLDQQHDFVVNFTFSRTGGEEDYLVRYISFRVLSPLDIASIEPSIGESLPVPVNDFNNFLLTLSNKGSEVIDYTVDVETDQEVLLLFKTPESGYSTNELEQEEFKLQPGSSTVYQVKVVALSEGEKSVDISFLNSGPCTNISDSLTFRVTGFEAGTGLFSFSEVSAWDWLSPLILIVLGCLFLYHNLK
ncbi:hypothetical protein GF352_03885, partial [archaeon]|nr:hypothetical protein [archaeon]